MLICVSHVLQILGSIWFLKNVACITGNSQNKYDTIMYIWFIVGRYNPFYKNNKSNVLLFIWNLL